MSHLPVFPYPVLDLSTGRGRLRYLAEVVLPGVDPAAFNLTNWADPSADPYDCGTAACAVGWAARDPLLAAEGLGLEVSRGPLSCSVQPRFGLYGNWAAVQEFFELDGADAPYELFSWDSYRHRRRATPADVAARLSAHLAATEAGAVR